MMAASRCIHPNLIGRLRICALALLGMVFGATAAPLRAGGQDETGLWGDQGDGTYRNPILAADYSDPDVCRVGSDYYLVASTFETSPGVTVLHSKDLVNWETIGAAVPDLTALSPEFGPTRMHRYGSGIFAPSIRYHAGKFWVCFPSYSGEGFYFSTATDPAGPWTLTQMCDKNNKPLRMTGWTDPCPIWTDDGKAYLAASWPGNGWQGYLFQMKPDGSQLLDGDFDFMRKKPTHVEPQTVGTIYSPFHSTEGNKLYQRGDYFYLVHIEFLNDGEGQGTYCFRAKHLYGDKSDGSGGQPGDLGEYEVIKWGKAASDVSGQELPGQGGLVDTPDGKWYWIGQYNQYGSDGRRPCLIPVQWINDWPVPGVNPGEHLHTKMVWQAPKPIVGEKPSLPLGSDAFDSDKLAPMWMWNHQPHEGGWSLTERPGFLRLHAYNPGQADRFFTASDTVCQRFMRSNQTTITAKIDVAGFVDGQVGGLAHFNGGKNDALLAVKQSGDDRELIYEENGNRKDVAPLPADQHDLWLRSVVKFDDLNAFSYSADGKAFTPVDGHFKLSTANYRGDMVGCFTFNNRADVGVMDVDSFTYEVGNRPEEK